MIQLFQAEWCPYCRRIRQRLTELDIDFIARQVPADRERRDELDRIAGTRSIPTLITSDGTILTGEDAIHAHLDTLREPPAAGEHRTRAATMRQRELQERHA